MRRSALVALGALWLGACAADHAAAPPARSAPSRVELVVHDTARAEGSDAPPRIDVMRGGARLVTAERAVRVVDGVLFVEGTTLERAGDDGSRVVLARDAGGPFAVAQDGRSIAMVVGERDASWGVVIVSGTGRRELAQGLGPIGALRFSDDGASLAFVGSVNGGVAGLWVADVRGSEAARCLTNCGLRTGAPWGSSFVAPPASAADIELGAEVIRYRAADGSEREVQWR